LLAARLMITAGSIGSAINIVVTIATERAPGMTMRLVPLFVWSTLIASIMIVFALPALAAPCCAPTSRSWRHAATQSPRRFPFACSVPGHQSMVGQVVVQ